MIEKFTQVFSEFRFVGLVQLFLVLKNWLPLLFLTVNIAHIIIVLQHETLGGLGAPVLHLRPDCALLISEVELAIFRLLSHISNVVRYDDHLKLPGFLFPLVCLLLLVKLGRVYTAHYTSLCCFISDPIISREYQLS